MNILNVPVELSERESYLKSNEHQLVIQSLSEIGTKNLGNFFTDDAVEDQFLMQTLASLAYSWNAFNSLRATYGVSSKKNRKSQLKDNLHGTDLLCNELVNLLKQCSDCKKSPAMNVSMLSQTYMKKLEVVKEIIAKVGQVNAKISDHFLLSNLRRPIKQQEGGKTNLVCRNPGELAECFCYNDYKLTWEVTFDNILEMENNGSLRQLLSCKQLKDIAYVISENIVISADEIECVKTNELYIKS